MAAPRGCPPDGPDAPPTGLPPEPGRLRLRQEDRLRSDRCEGQYLGDDEVGWKGRDTMKDFVMLKEEEETALSGQKMTENNVSR